MWMDVFVGIAPGLRLFVDYRLFHSSVSAVLAVEWPLVGGEGGSVLAGSVDSPFMLGFSWVSGGRLRGATDTRVFPWFS